MTHTHTSKKGNQIKKNETKNKGTNEVKGESTSEGKSEDTSEGTSEGTSEDKGISETYMRSKNPKER